MGRLGEGVPRLSHVHRLERSGAPQGTQAIDAINERRVCRQEAGRSLFKMLHWIDDVHVRGGLRRHLKDLFISGQLRERTLETSWITRELDSGCIGEVLALS